MWVLLSTSRGTRAAGTEAVGVGVGVTLADGDGDGEGEVEGDVGGTIVIVPLVPVWLGDAVEGVADRDDVWAEVATGAGFFPSPRHFRAAMTPTMTSPTPRSESSSSRLFRSARRWLPGGRGASSSLT
jgi:hypothetical protein